MIFPFLKFVHDQVSASSNSYGLCFTRNLTLATWRGSSFTKVDCGLNDQTRLRIHSDIGLTKTEHPIRIGRYWGEPLLGRVGRLGVSLASTIPIAAQRDFVSTPTLD